MLSALAVGVLACGGEKAPEPNATESARAALPVGEAYVAVEGGKIWYKVSGSGSATPVILLHGGPGFSSFYMKPVEALSDERPVVRYDQLGQGKSDATSDTTLFTIERYVSELEALRASLGYDKIHIVGHSWGTQLGLEYYRAHPDHVASLTLMGAALNTREWEDNTKKLIATLSDSAQKALAAGEAARKYDSNEYQAANAEFIAKYVVRQPGGADFDSTFAMMGLPVYTYMWGPSEYTVTGTLKTYNGTMFLKNVKVPTLFTVGSADTADPETIKKHAAMTPGATVAVIPNAGHLTMVDNLEGTLKPIRDFLRRVDAAAK